MDNHLFELYEQALEEDKKFIEGYCFTWGLIVFVLGCSFWIYLDWQVWKAVTGGH